MNGPIAQIVALTCFGKAFLLGNELDGYSDQNSTAQFCDRISFEAMGRSWFGGGKKREIAPSPRAWFDFLRSRGATSLSLVLTPQNAPQISDRNSSAFVGGGGTWLIEVHLPKGLHELWAAQWEVWNRDAPEHRIWRVTYLCVGNSATTSPPPVDRDTAVQRLRTALEEILAFSERQDTNFTESFRSALNSLNESPEVNPGYHQDLTPEGFLDEKSKRLLNAAQHGWVFGGMGSWNDLGFEGEDQKVYERVSDSLFNAMREAILAAVNSQPQAQTSEPKQGLS